MSPLPCYIGWVTTLGKPKKKFFSLLMAGPLREGYFSPKIGGRKKIVKIPFRLFKNKKSVIAVICYAKQDSLATITV